MIRWRHCRIASTWRTHRVRHGQVQAFCRPSGGPACPTCIRHPTGSPVRFAPRRCGPPSTAAIHAYLPDHPSGLCRTRQPGRSLRRRQTRRFREYTPPYRPRAGRDRNFRRSTDSRHDRRPDGPHPDKHHAPAYLRSCVGWPEAHGDPREVDRKAEAVPLHMAAVQARPLRFVARRAPHLLPPRPSGHRLAAARGRDGLERGRLWHGGLGVDRAGWCTTATATATATASASCHLHLHLRYRLRLHLRRLHRPHRHLRPRRLLHPRRPRHLHRLLHPRPHRHPRRGG